MAEHEENARVVKMTARTTTMTYQPEPRDGLTGSGQFGAAEVIQTIAVAAAPVAGLIGNQIAKQRGQDQRRCRHRTEAHRVRPGATR